MTAPGTSQKFSWLIASSSFLGILTLAFLSHMYLLSLARLKSEELIASHINAGKSLDDIKASSELTHYFPKDGKIQYEALHFAIQVRNKQYASALQWISNNAPFNFPNRDFLKDNLAKFTNQNDQTAQHDEALNQSILQKAYSSLSEVIFKPLPPVAQKMYDIRKSNE